MTPAMQFKERFIDLVSDCFGRVTHEDAVMVAAEFLTRIEGEKVHPILREGSPYDMVEVFGDELRLYMLDDKLLERGNKTVCRQDFADQAAPLYAFLRSASRPTEAVPDDEIEKIVFAAVRTLARDPTAESDIAKVSLHFISLNETADSPTMKVLMRFGDLRVGIYVRNLACANDLHEASPFVTLEAIADEMRKKRKGGGDGVPHAVQAAESASGGIVADALPDEERLESYEAFKDGVLELAEQGPGQDGFQNLLHLIACILDVTGEAKACVADDPGTPYDMVALSESSLNLYLVDREAFEREEGSLSILDYRDRTARLAGFVKAARKGRIVSSPDHLHPDVPKLIREIGCEKAGPARFLKICLISFNPVDSRKGRPTATTLDGSDIVVDCRSLSELWLSHRSELSQWLRCEQKRPERTRSAATVANTPKVIRSIPPIGSARGARVARGETSTVANPQVAPEQTAHGPFFVGREAGTVSPDRPLKKLIFDGTQMETAVSSVAAVFAADTPPKSDAGAATNADDFRERILKEASVGVAHYRLWDIVKDILTEARKFEEVVDAPLFDKSCAGRTVSVDGYAYDETNGVLTLILLDDDTFSEEPTEILKVDYEEKVDKMRVFFSLASDGTLIRDYIDVNTDEGNCAYNIRYWIDNDQITRVEYVVVSMGLNTMRKSVKPLEGKYNGIRWSARLIDYITLYEYAKSDPTPRIDFREIAPEDTVLLLQTVDESVGYGAYVGRIAASTLVEIYDRFGQRVLSGNVRAFLSSTNKVNRGMLETIRSDRGTFFAYNNGVCIVAESIETEHKDGVDKLLRAVDFQIVNGGQTTATLHYAKTKKDLDLDGIYVQMKLTVMPHDMNADKRLLFVKNVSKYANSQSKVQDSDLGANTLFQIAFKKASDSPRCMFTSTERRIPYYWYYERSRGSYKVEHIKDEATKLSVGKARFDDRYPKAYKFDKTDLAKWILTFDELPHIVSQGSQKCYLAFSKRVGVIESKDPRLAFVTPDFVKYCIGKGMVFRRTDEIVRKTRWYKEKRSYKANLVTYGLAALARLIRRRWGENATLDFIGFAAVQSLPEALDEILESFAKTARDVFNHPDKTYDDVGEWVKKRECWELLKKFRTSLTPQEELALAPYVLEVEEPIDCGRKM